MDSLPSKIIFSFVIDEEEMGREDLREHWQVYLRVVGDFKIHINEKIFYRETQFCLVEFAAQLSKWLNRGEYSKEFIYTSMESEEERLIWFRKEWNGWRIGSIYQEYEESTTFNDEAIIAPASEYIENLRNTLLTDYNISIDKLLTGAVEI